MPKPRKKTINDDFNEDNIDLFDDIDKHHLQDDIDMSDKSESDVEPVFGIETSDEELGSGSESDGNGNPKGGEVFDDESNLEEDEDEVSRSFWGTKKSSYYNSDSIHLSKNTKGERKSKQQRELEKKELLKMEEEEALILQQQMMQELKDEDFGLNYFKEMSEKYATTKVTTGKMADSIGEDKATHLPRDLMALTTKQKKRLLSKESPELLSWALESGKYMAELESFLNPLLNAYLTVHLDRSDDKEAITQNYSPKRQKLFAMIKALNPSFIRVLSMRRHLISLYLVNLSYYMYLKSRSLLVQTTNIYSHPVVLRLKAYSKLLDTIELKVLRLHKEALLTLANSLSKITLDCEKYQATTTAKKAAVLGYHPSECKGTRSDAAFDKTLTDSLKAPQTSLEDQRIIKQIETPAGPGHKVIEHGSHNARKNIRKKGVEFVENIEPENGKRAINYEIAKNKGLTPKRKKEYRNPRVKHKLRFKKALIKRKSQVRIPRKEINKYGGETTGIKVGLKRSIKIR